MLRLGGPAVPVQTCTRRLAALGATTAATPPRAPARSPDRGGHALELGLTAGHLTGAPGRLDCRVSWHGPAGLARDRPASEATVQALCGLMEVHGRDSGRPRRLGLDVASVGAGMLASQGVLAALLARCRGRPIAAVETSVLQAGLLLVSHHFALATCPSEVPVLPEEGLGPGPPFPTAEGQWLELETLDPEVWRRFWLALGVCGRGLGRAWTAFWLRYRRGRCSLPHSLHEATARRTVAELAETADACGMSMCRVRHYADVLAEAGRWQDHATVEPLADGRGHPPAGAGGPAGSRRAPTPRGGLPLEGLRVAEATNRVQGPLAGLLLQMLGAQVVRVEPPGGPMGRGKDRDGFFLSFNRHKESVELDLARPAGRAGLLELASEVDVFLNNWRPGRAAAWGLQAEDLARGNPRLVYAHASGWGQATKMAGVLGTDFMVQAYSAVGEGVNPEGEPPFPTRVLLTDSVGALLACEGVLTALLLRERSGVGYRVDSSLLAAALTLQAPVLDALRTGREEGRSRGRPVWGMLDRPVEAADGFVVLTAEGDADLPGLCEAFGVDSSPAAPSRAARLLVGRMATLPAAHCEQLLLEAGVPCSVTSTDLAALAADPRMECLFEPLTATGRAPASPWAFRS